ncbi:nuclear transport factor 2-like protein [Chitinimonas naiadis]
MNSPLPHPLTTFLDAINRNDTQAFLAHFPANGVVDDWGTRYQGHASILGWSAREFIGANVNLQVTSISQQGSEFSILADVGGRGYTGPSRFVLDFENDKVREMRITTH